MEARLYAEDPNDDWRPQTGTIAALDLPGVTSHFEIPAHHGLRLDSGVEAGSVIGTHYDAMIAKVISFAPTRAEAARELASALRRGRVHGLATNRDLLVASLLHPEMLAGTADTSFYDRHDPTSLTADASLAPDLAALIASIADGARTRAQRQVPGPVGGGFRNVPSIFQRRGYAHGEQELHVGHRLGHEGLEVEALPAGVTSVDIIEATAGSVVIDSDGVRRRFDVAPIPAGDGGDAAVAIDSPMGSLTLRVLPRFVDPAAQKPAGTLVAPMPGSIIGVAVQVGDEVTTGQPLLYLEAMKMEHEVAAPASGTVVEISVSVGQQVEQGATLAVVEDQSRGEDEA
uniref:Biotin/lipoyl-binding protein n=2 Tax=Janibacter limosus TaxID=53458 RepID=A0AC61U8B8_9MICO